MSRPFERTGAEEARSRATISGTAHGHDAPRLPEDRCEAIRSKVRSGGCGSISALGLETGHASGQGAIRRLELFDGRLERFGAILQLDVFGSKIAHCRLHRGRPEEEPAEKG